MSDAKRLSRRKRNANDDLVRPRRGRGAEGAKFPNEAYGPLDSTSHGQDDGSFHANDEVVEETETIDDSLDVRHLDLASESQELHNRMVVTESMLVFVSQDKRELHYIVPVRRLENYHIRYRDFIFVGFRILPCSDSEHSNGGHNDVIVGWCNGERHCSEPPFRRATFPESSLDFSKDKSDFGPFCECAKALYGHIGGHCMIRQQVRTLDETVNFETNGKPHIIYNWRVARHEYEVVNLNQEHDLVFSQWGVSRRHEGRYLCQTCTNKSRHCAHNKALLGIGEGSMLHGPGVSRKEVAEKSISSMLDETRNLKAPCISRRKLPFFPNRDANVLQHFKDFKAGTFRLPEFVRPDTSCCDAKEQMQETVHDMTVYSSISVMSTKYVGIYCPQCKADHLPDGKEHGILVVTKKVAFLHECLFKWQFQFALDNDGFYKFWRATVAQYTDNTNDSDNDIGGRHMKLTMFERTRKMFTRAAKSFVILHYLDYKHAFSCKCQSGTPAAIQLDGTYLSMLKSRFHASTPHLTADDQLVENPVATRGTTFKDRVFIKEKDLRDDIHRIFIVKPGGVVTGATAPPIHELRAIIHRLEEHYPNYANLFEIAFERVLDGDVQEGTRIHHRYMEIMRTLALKAPVCHIVKPAIMPAIQKIIDGEPVMDVLPSICKHSPMLARLLHGADGGIADHLTRDLFKEILPIARQAFDVDPHPEDDGEEFQGDEEEFHGEENPPSRWSEDESFLRTCIWSGLTRDNYAPSTNGGNHFHRRRPVYGADRKKMKMSCTKHKLGSSSHTPGIMLHWCLHCHQCVLVGMMDDTESPKTAFDHFYTLYKDPPKAVSYDNGCNLHQYVLLREAALFKDTEFFIDEFHALGHTRCSLNYNSSQFKWRATDWSLAEQKNNPLSLLKNSFAHMDQGTFLLFLRFKLACMNIYQSEDDSANSNVVFWKPPPRRIRMHVIRDVDEEGEEEEEEDDMLEMLVELAKEEELDELLEDAIRNDGEQEDDEDDEDYD